EAKQRRTQPARWTFHLRRRGIQVVLAGCLPPYERKRGELSESARTPGAGRQEGREVRACICATGLQLREYGRGWVRKPERRLAARREVRPTGTRSGPYSSGGAFQAWRRGILLQMGLGVCTKRV